MIYTADSPLLNLATGDPEHAVAVIAPRSINYDEASVRMIVRGYAAHSTALGIDFFLALGQLWHETDCLSDWWSARPRRNPAGLGVDGTMKAGRADRPPGKNWQWDPRTGIWRAGCAFGEWVPDAVQAHLGRLLAYALPSGHGTDAQQAAIAYALSRRALPARYRGAAPTLRGLDGRWNAHVTGYPAKIADKANVLRGAT